MADQARTLTASRSAFLELQEELRLVNDGYEFLDEKRILLATEMLRQRDAYRAENEKFLKLCETAAATLLEAAVEQGLDGLQVHPAAEMSKARVDTETRPYVGQTMVEARFDPGEATMPGTAGKLSPKIRACSDGFRQLLSAGAPLAARAANLQRLMHEYRRTERRVRALDHVVLPEIRSDLATMAEHLDLNDQEEVLRVRSARGSHSSENAEPSNQTS